MRLGKRLTYGFLLSLAALGVYYFLARHVIGDNRLTEFDRRVAASLHTEALDSPKMRDFFRVITAFGEFATLATLSLSVALVLIWWRHRLLALVWLIAQAGGGLLNYILKEAIERQRPDSDALVHPPGYSFPSGHSMASLIAYGMLAYLLILGIPIRWLRIALAGLLALLVLAIGFSRIFLVAHFVSDVIGGYCVATIWLMFCIASIETVRHRKLRMEAAAMKTAAES